MMAVNKVKPDKINKSSNGWFWNGLADWGLVFGFGLLSYFLFCKLISDLLIVFSSMSEYARHIGIIPCRIELGDFV